MDDFERSSLGPYTGATDGFRIQSGETFRGDSALELGRIGTEIYATEGLPAFPRAGDTVRWAVNLGPGGGAGPNVNLRLGVQSPDDWYSVNVGVNDGLKLRGKFDGEGRLLAADRFDPPPGTWLPVELDWEGDGQLTAQVLDGDGNALATAAATDTRFTAGGIGWRAVDARGEPRYADGVQVVR